MFKLIEKEEIGCLQNIEDKQKLYLEETKKFHVGTEWWWLIRSANSFQYAGSMTGLRAGTEKADPGDWRPPIGQS